MRLRVVNLGGEALEQVTVGITTVTGQPFVLLKLEAEPLVVSVWLVGDTVDFPVLKSSS